MGKSSKPLTLLVHDDVYQECREVFEKMEGQGHLVDRYQSGEDEEFPVGRYDMVLGPNAWRMFGPLTKYLKDAIDAGREVRYGPTKKANTANL